MNIYHRYIDIPFTYEKPEQFTETDVFIRYVGKDIVTNEFKEWLSTYNLHLSNVIEGFYTAKGNRVTVPLHNDMTIKPGVNDAVKLNFTWGPVESKTRWWKVKDEDSLIEIVHDTNEVNEGFKQAGIVPDIECDKCYTARDEDVEMVYEKTIDKPSLLNVGQLHSTYNPGNEDRWTLSFTLLKEDNSHLTFDEALELFKDVVYE